MRDILEVVGPIAFTMCVLSIPVVAMLLRHQRYMAELVNRRVEPNNSPEIAELKLEVRALRDHINRLTLQLDGRTPTFTPPEIPNRS